MHHSQNIMNFLYLLGAVKNGKYFDDKSYQ